MSWIELKLSTRVVPQEGVAQVAYAVTATVLAAHGIPAELFTFSTSDDVYSNAATLRDLLTFPASAALAREQGADFYRLAAATQTFDRPAGVEAFKAYVQATLRRTNAAWSATQPLVVGEDTVVVYDSNNP
jgi:hypothetical protein